LLRIYAPFEQFWEVVGLAKKLWSGRFAGNTDPRVETFSQSISFDCRLFKQDIRCSIAHAHMLAHVGLLSREECQQIVQCLSQIEAEIENRSLPLRPELEDIHMNIETVLIERLGDIGRKLHTARSRNDQVATDVKLWMREALDRVDERLKELQRAFVSNAERHPSLIIPGYTHLQRAQPVLAAHVLLAYVEKLERDRSRLADCRCRLNVLPLGAAALAGTSLSIDCDHVARELGFLGTAANSLDVSSDRDFVLESVFVLTMIAEHLSGWAEDWILWSTQEFGFLSLPEVICTGSSIMPQKRNPDVLELIRGRTARVIGNLTALLVLVKGLPLAYNRDLQEDKERLFDAFDTVEGCLELATVTVEGASFCTSGIAETLDEGFLDATTLMEFLIERGVPQRTAHEVIGKLVSLCERRGLKRLRDLSDAELIEMHPKLDSQARMVLGVENAIKAFRSSGSTAPSEVRAQVDRWKRKFAERQ
jgi:argininosuccinate lyase